MPLPPPNLAISVQMTMKLGSKLSKSFDDVIVISMLWRHHHLDVSRHIKDWKVFEGFAEYLKNDSTDFHQTYVIL